MCIYVERTEVCVCTCTEDSSVYNIHVQRTEVLYTEDSSVYNIHVQRTEVLYTEDSNVYNIHVQRTEVCIIYMYRGLKCV